MEGTKKYLFNNPKITLAVKTLFVLLLLSASFCFSAKAQAASLYLSPGSGSYLVGKTFTVNVYVSSPDEAINAASGVVSFPEHELEVTSLNKGSTISLWVQEPSFSNSAGTVKFEGIILNPGFKGSSGKIIAINFRVKNIGKANLSFTSGSILANDGQGTNIISGLGSASFDLGVVSTPHAEDTAATPAPAPASGLPPAPFITSETHPDSNSWYSSKTAKFNWSLPNGTTAVRLLADKNPQSTPSVNYSPAISAKDLSNLTDGVWYLHVRLKNSIGWGAISHFRFQVDSEPPRPFSIEFIDGTETVNPQPIASFNTTDSISGINHYSLKIGDGDFIEFAPSDDNLYKLPLQKPGKKTLIVQAYDYAGNYSVSSEEFTILPSDAPVITECPDRLYTDQVLEIKGSASPGAQITVWLQKEDRKAFGQITFCDTNGNFHFIAEKKLDSGAYRVWAEAIEKNGSQSEPSEVKMLVVTLPLQLKLGKIFIDYVAVINALLVMVIGLCFIAGFLWYKMSVWRKRIKKETADAEKKLRKAFSLLSEEAKKQISKFDGETEMSDHEKILYERLKKALNSSEKIIQKEIEDINRVVKKNIFRRLFFWRK